jgi:hypothetical protein
LQLLAQRGVSALWPIGIWRRSAASRSMKVSAGDVRYSHRHRHGAEPCRHRWALGQ